jgi:hypothetical protein
VWLARRYPKDTVFEDDEMWQITRATMALELKKLPSEIDTMPIEDVMYVMAVLNERGNPDG